MPGRSFTRFTGKQRPASPPTLTIQRSGNVTISRGASEALGWPSHIVLLFDEAARVLGLQPAAADEPGAYALRLVSDKGTTRTFSFAALARAYGIPLTPSRRYRAELVDGVLEVDLSAEPLARSGDNQNGDVDGGTRGR